MLQRTLFLEVRVRLLLPLVDGLRLQKLVYRLRIGELRRLEGGDLGYDAAA